MIGIRLKILDHGSKKQVIDSAGIYEVIRNFTIPGSTQLILSRLGFEKKRNRAPWGP